MISNYVGVLRKYAVFRGRATRSEYWWFTLTHIIVLIALAILAMIGTQLNPGEVPSLALPLILYMIGTIIPGLAVTVRRLHDAGYSGWWALMLLTSIGSIVVFIFTLLPSERGDNKHGPYPH